ncbi:MAG: aminoglycoside phosphotransferase family protein [Parcubacteria group bacterium]|jgi:aminoglycoside 2''-phosphotransferase
MLIKESKEEYLKVIKENFPEVSFSRAELITKGWDNNVILLDDNFVFRFPKRVGYDLRFRSELKLLKYLETKLNLPIPHYAYVAENIPCGGYVKIPGIEMQPEIFNQLEEKQIEQIAKQLGNFLSILHQTPIDFVKEYGFGEARSSYWWNKEQLGDTLQKLKELVFPRLEKEEISWIEHQIEQYSATSAGFENVVIHSNIKPEHIFIDPVKKSLTGVIDFSDVEIADPALDFSGLWYYGDSFPEKVLSFYAGKIDEGFLKRSKFYYLMRDVNNMLEISDGENMPITFEESQKKFNAFLKSPK